MTDQERLRQILDTLAATYPDAKPALEFTSPFELLVATILSAQCTDNQVNKVTRVLFADYPTARDMATLTPEQLEPYIHSCGFYHNKAKNIIATCRALVERYGGEVPEDREQLELLPGVGRKTAGVVLANAFGRDAIAVDTHVFRVSNRLGLVQAKDVWQTEQQLMANIPQSQWSDAHHWILYHGRRVCAARNPKCAVCTVRQWCPSRQDAPKTAG